jgi:hypothetical protein
MLIRTFTVFISLSVAVPAAAVIVDIDAFDNRPQNPVEIDLPAGAYTLVPVDGAGGGAYTATNFWGVVEDCDPSGADCRYGWIWQYVYESDSIRETDVRVPDRWATPELAFAGATPVSFDLYEPETVSFYFVDCYDFDDNEGGVSLDVRLVPEPGRATLVVVGLLGLVARAASLRPNRA